MFQIREDVYRRRELADKLKIAFATAASAALGAGLAYSTAGNAGPVLYAGCAAACLALTEIYYRKNSSRFLPDLVPFHDIAPAVRKIAQKAGMQPPRVFLATFRKDKSPARTDGESVFFDSGYVEGASAADIVATLAHEMAHIKNGDLKYGRRIELPLSLAKDLVPIVTLAHGISIESLRQISFSLLFLLAAREVSRWDKHIYNLGSRARERRADRLAARWTDCPLDLATSFETEGRKVAEDMTWRQWQKLGKYSLAWIFHATHPDTGDRIRALVTLCKRVPNPPAEKLRELSL